MSLCHQLSLIFGESMKLDITCTAPNNVVYAFVTSCGDHLDGWQSKERRGRIGKHIH